tara:strand:- start:1162 stop:1368 length:207 start_codon:yes stop_codon:yes gene_type:complete
MESSNIKFKRANSLDNPLFNTLKMNKEERLTKIKELSSMIVDLKSNRSIDTKKTIQKLQQQMDNLTHE